MMFKRNFFWERHLYVGAETCFEVKNLISSYTTKVFPVNEQQTSFNNWGY